MQTGWTLENRKSSEGKVDLESHLAYDHEVFKDLTPKSNVIKGAIFDFCIFDGCHFEAAYFMDCEVNAVFINCTGSIFMSKCEGKVITDESLEIDSYFSKGLTQRYARQRG